MQGADVDEGGVARGYACLDSIVFDDREAI